MTPADEASSALSLKVKSNDRHPGQAENWLYIKLFAMNFETDCIQSVTCRKRKRLSVFRHYLKTHTCYNHITFKFYRNKWNHLLQLSKTNCENEQFMINKAKTKEIWKGIKQLVGQKTEGSTLPGILTINEQEITKSMIKPLLINWINSCLKLENKTWSQLYQNQIYHLIFIKISPIPLVSSYHLPMQLRLRI